MRRKNTTLLRSCHSGWSKNVRSWIVTTHGTRGAQRHRVVRAVPHVGSHAVPRAPAPRACSHASRAGRRPGAAACTVGAGRERRPTVPRRRAACRRCRSTSARAASPEASATVYTPAPTGRAGTAETSRRTRTARSLRGLQPCGAQRVATGARPRVRTRRRGPRPSAASELGRARPARARRASRAARRRRAVVRARRCTPRRRRAGTAARRRRRPLRAPSPPRPRAARRARSPRAPAARSLRSATRCSTPPTRRMSASTTGHGCSPSTRTNGRSMPLDAAPARRPDDDELEVRSRRATRSRSTASTIVGRSLRGSTVPTVSTYGASMPTLATAASMSASVRGSGVSTPSSATCTSSGLKPSRIELDARERRRRDHEVGVRGARRRAPRRWKLTPRRVVTCGTRRNAMSCTVTTSAASRTGGTARLGACTTSASSSTSGRRSRCQHS